jgi:hypothetical protein
MYRESLTRLGYLKLKIFQRYGREVHAKICMTALLSLLRGLAFLNLHQRLTPWNSFCRRFAAAMVGFVWAALLMLLLFTIPSAAATKPHAISFGRWMTVDWITGTDKEKPLTLKVRALIIDTRVKEYVTGAPHEITERLFVVRRVFRMNDSLPEDSAPRWQWQRGGWLLVDRVTGRISPINLPDFDPLYSAASWYRDYVAYCGVSDDGKKTFAIVAQLNRRKAVLKKARLEGIPDDGALDSACPAPEWQRSPARVTFLAAGSEKQTFAIRGHVVDVVNDDDEE